MKTFQATSIFGVLLYILAVITGLLLIIVSTWADMEAASYGFQRRASASLSGLACPILLTRKETGTISLSVSNTTDTPLHPSVRTEISYDFEPQVFNEAVDLAPGESKRLEWSVGPENIDLGNFILANVLVYASYPIPNREKTCGTFVIDLPGSGTTILIGLVAFSLIGLGWGLYLMSKSDFRQGNAGNVWNGIIWLTVLIVSGLILSFIGSWIPSLGILVVSVLISNLLVNSLILRGS